MELAKITPTSLSNTENIYPVSLCELNTKFTNKCCADWSKSNLISVVTPDGIYILKPQLNNQDGPFQIDIIRNPVVKFKHKFLEDTIPAIDSNWQKLTNDQYIEAFLDPALNTHIDSLSSNLYPRQFKFSKWSPIVDIYPKQCLLAVITIDYQLLIYKGTTETWNVEFDLSDEYDKIVAHSDNDTSNMTILEDDSMTTKPTNNQDLTNNSNENSFEETRKKLHALSFCNVCWKTTKNNDLLLLAATITGDIIVWQFSWHQNFLNKSEGIKPALSVKVILQTNIFMITGMQLYEDLLIISSQNGQVVLYDLTLNFEQEFSVNIKQPFENNSKTLNSFSLLPTATLWYKDDIEVADFFVQQLSQESFRIVIAKATNICWCLIFYTKHTGDEPAKLNINDTFSAIDGKDPDVSLHQTPATCLKPAGLNKAVLVADDGSFLRLEFPHNQLDSVPEFTAIRTGKIDLTRLVPKGLCTSPNGNLITMISYIALMYEPDKIPCPTKIVLLPFSSDRNFVNECLEKLLDERWLTDNNVRSPMDVCDFIDYMRSIYPILTSEQSSEIYKIFSDSILKTGIPTNKFQLTKLKIIAFLLTKLFEQQNGPKMIDGISISLDLTTQIYDIILLYNIGETLEKILNTKKIDDSGDEYNFNTIQIVSLRNYFEWLTKCDDRLVILNKYKEKFELLMKKFSSNVAPESCPICHTRIPFISPRYGICNSGHRFDRCARSLIILKLEKANDLVCEHCNRHYMTSLIWPTDNLWLCSHCQ